MSLRRLRVGLVGEENAPWEYVRAQALNFDIELTLKIYADYFSPNAALLAGELELNAFQHRAFLQAERRTKGYDFVVLATTYFDPIGLYSSTLKSVTELTANAEIAVPEDSTNELRSLKVLAAAGLISLSDGRITANPLNLRFKRVSADKLCAVLSSVSAAFINGNYAFAAGLNPATAPILREHFSRFEDDNPYVKVIVCRSDLHAELLEAAQKVTALYRTPEVAAILKTVQGGSLYPAF